MRLLLCLLVVTCAWASEDESRAKKQPFVVDAVGNTLPPPSSVPATVGSPVNLLTPDRYEFYTFDESGELVKRLMTLEEIQAIVAAGEEAEGLVTFSNDNQPTMAFNFSQPPHNKVHSVVTNVQNVLKAQMEAHKNNPVVQPTLDTPDVSDSWSLILPSIFGNTGLDIVPDKVANSVTPPETDTLDFNDINLEINPDFTSKEGNTDVSSISSTNVINESLKSVSTTTEIVETIKNSSTTTTKTIPTTTTTVAPATTSTTTTSKTSTSRPKSTTTKKPTTTSKPTTTTKRATTIKTTTTTLKPIRRTTTTIKPSTVKATTVRQPVTTLTTKKATKPVSTTESTVKITTTQAALSTTNLPLTSNVSSLPTILRTTTTRPKIVNTINSNVTSTTPKSGTPTSSKTTEKQTTRITTSKPFTTQNQPAIDSTTLKVPKPNINKDEVLDTVSATDKNTVQYEKIDTFLPVSAATYVPERTTPNTSKEILASTTSINLTTTTEKINTVTQKSQPTITTNKPTIEESNYVLSTAHNQDSDKFNATTITTQSVSPSTTVSSTEFIKLENSHNGNVSGIKPAGEMHASDNMEPEMHIFDVVQSFSQIASDLGSSYMPIPTVSNVLDSTKLNHMDLESKENFELDILTDLESKKSNITDNNKDNFIKISTLDPHGQNEEKEAIEKDTTNKDTNITQPDATEKFAAATFESTTIDRVLSESMGDFLSQVVNQAPLLESDNNFDLESKATTEKYIDSTTTEFLSDVITTTSEIVHMNSESDKSDNDISSLEKTSENATSSIVVSTEVPLMLNNKISTNEKTQIEGSNKTYVPIPNLNDKNTSLEVKLPENKLINDTKNTNNNKKTTESTIEEISKTTTKVIQTFETTTSIKPIVSEMLHAAMPNEPSTADSMDTNKTNKIPDYVPKIDEFKKKIQKVNIDDKELANERNNSWKLISTVSPPKSNEITKDKIKNNVKTPGDNNSKDKDIILDFSKENQGLEVTTKDLEEDVAKFTELCNELAFRYWNTITENIDKRRSFVLSPYSITSMLAMMFMGARGATSGEMNDILKLDDMVTFNPHFTLKNISDSIETTPDSGVIVSAFIRELYSDRNKGKILTFYKERAQQFYNGHVEEINFKLISDIIRRRTNLLVKRYTWGKIAEYMKANTITMQPPLAAFSANIFQTDCTGSSVEGRDGEMYFVVSPTVRQRRLVPVPAVVYRGGFLAGYDPVLDATAAALGNTNSIISTLFVMPGQQGNVVHGEDLEALEQRMLDTNPTTPAWNRLLRTLLPRIGLELQIPRFSHKSIFNVSYTLRNMGLKDLFDADHADLGGLNGPSKDLYLSDMIQSTSFVTCGEGVIGEQHHVEDYPESLGTAARRRSSRWASDWDEPRDYQRAFHDPHDVGEAMHLPLHLRPRQARLPSRNAQPARLKFDRPFLYFVRHNPSGMILYVGRYNPRLLP